MNKLTTKQRAQILHMLVEGNSLRATARMANVSRNTVDKLLQDVGAACLDYQDSVLRNLPCTTIECDEIWTFVYAREKNVLKDKKSQFGYGDVWTWTAICPDTKLVPCWHVGSRNLTAARPFIDDLAGRLANRIQLSTEGHKPYLKAVDESFGGDIDYASIVKLYGDEDEKGQTKRRTAGGAKVIGTRKTVVSGNPDHGRITTSYAERQNLTMRMSMRRFTRLTNGFSKKVENHMHAISLHYMFYNFGRIHQSLKVTPAMAAGITDHVWTLEEIAELAPIKAPKQRGTYRSRA
ncbi:MAG: IS1 family transposase [Woeseia sp.]